MAIRAPWKGRVGRIGMPVVSALIVANTMAIFVLSLFSAAAVELAGESGVDGNDDYYDVKDRVVLGVFWCTAPAFLGLVTISELFCLWTDKLAPLWVLISSSTAIVLWAGQMTIWQLCVSGHESTSTPGYCPQIYHNVNPVPYFEWYTANASAPVAAVPTLIIFYITQLSFAAIVVARQRRYSFRRSDMLQPWERKSFDASEDTLASLTRGTRSRALSVAEQERMLYTSPSPQSLRSVSDPQRKSASSWHSFSGFSGTWDRVASS